MIGWQEVIAVAIVAAAVLVLVRRARRSGVQGGCGGCGHESHAPRDPASADRGVKITEVYTLRVERRTVPAAAESAPPPMLPADITPADHPTPGADSHV